MNFIELSLLLGYCNVSSGLKFTSLRNERCFTSFVKAFQFRRGVLGVRFVTCDIKNWIKKTDSLIRLRSGRFEFQSGYYNDQTRFNRDKTSSFLCRLESFRVWYGSLERKTPWAPHTRAPARPTIFHRKRTSWTPFGKIVGRTDRRGQNVVEVAGIDREGRSFQSGADVEMGPASCPPVGRLHNLIFKKKYSDTSSFSSATSFFLAWMNILFPI